MVAGMVCQKRHFVFLSNALVLQNSWAMGQVTGRIADPKEKLKKKQGMLLTASELCKRSAAKIPAGI